MATSWTRRCCQPHAPPHRRWEHHAAVFKIFNMLSTGYSVLGESTVWNHGIKHNSPQHDQLNSASMHRPAMVDTATVSNTHDVVCVVAWITLRHLKQNRNKTSVKISCGTEWHLPVDILLRSFQLPQPFPYSLVPMHTNMPSIFLGKYYRLIGSFKLMSQKSIRVTLWNLNFKQSGLTVSSYISVNGGSVTTKFVKYIELTQYVNTKCTSLFL
jgi:hypothetical protein